MNKNPNVSLKNQFLSSQVSVAKITEKLSWYARRYFWGKNQLKDTNLVSLCLWYAEKNQIKDLVITYLNFVFSIRKKTLGVMCIRN